jgi:translation initiation factor IF-1
MDSDGEGSAGRLATGRTQVSGVVMETLPSALYKVRLDEGSLVMAHIADRMDRNFVRLLVGDKVRLELSPQNVGRGRIIGKIG